MFVEVKDQVNNGFFEGNKNALKILAAHKEFTEAKIGAAEALNAELSARLRTVEESLIEAHEEIVTRQKQFSKKVEAGGGGGG